MSNFWITFRQSAMADIKNWPEQVESASTFQSIDFNGLFAISNIFSLNKLQNREF